MVCSVGAPQQQAYANRGQSQPKTASQDLTTGTPAEPGRRIVGGRWPQEVANLGYLRNFESETQTVT